MEYCTKHGLLCSGALLHLASFRLLIFILTRSHLCGQSSEALMLLTRSAEATWNQQNRTKAISPHHPVKKTIKQKNVIDIYVNIYWQSYMWHKRYAAKGFEHCGISKTSNCNNQIWRMLAVKKKKLMKISFQAETIKVKEVLGLNGPVGRITAERLRGVFFVSLWSTLLRSSHHIILPPCPTD